MRKPSSLATLIILFAVLAYVAYRAATLSITHDEAYTYTRYVHHTYFEIATYKTGNVLPNNHLLNTFGQKFFSHVFGPKEFSLRLLSVLSCLIFLVSAFLIAKKFAPKHLLFAFGILVLHPYVIDFMMLSRGYGIAMGFMMLSLYFMLESITQNFRSRTFAFGLIAGVFSVLANFSWLNYVLAVCAVYLFLQFFIRDPADGKKYQPLLRNALIMLACLAVLALMIYTPLQVIIHRNMLFGGEKGFWADTVLSLCDRLAYGASYRNAWMIFMQVLIVSAVLGSLGTIISVYRKVKLDAENTRLLFALLLILVMASIVVLQFHFMGSFYPKERTALFFIPAFFLLVVLLLTSLDSIIKGTSKNSGVNSIPPLGAGVKWRKSEVFRSPLKNKISYSSLAFYVLAAIFALHMLRSLNLSYVLDWKYDANTREISHDIEALDSVVLLGVHPFFQPAMEFYRWTDHLTKYGELHVDGYRREGVFDYFVIPPEDRQKLEQEQLMIVKEYQPSGVVLAKHK